jgi:chromate reductase, NAD(P)H dehydrogenase (quinone)
MRVLAISGSLRGRSTNTAALAALTRLAPEGVRVLLYQELATLPPFNPDDDAEDRPVPEPVGTLRALVGASDAIVIAAPEYAHGLPG